MKLSDLPEPIQVELIKAATEVYKSDKGWKFYECVKMVLSSYVNTDTKQ